MSDWMQQQSRGAVIAYAIIYGILFFGVIALFVALGAATGPAGILFCLIFVGICFPFLGIVFFDAVRELRRRASSGDRT